MFTLVVVVKALAEIALLAMAGRWLLGLLAGAKREQNFFYQILQILTKPFIRAARLVTPRLVIDQHIPLVAFLVLVFIWVFAVGTKIQMCAELRGFCQ